MIIVTSATPFLKTLLTTTTESTHISDFRNLPRSDSRADKPDHFPGFDFLEEPTTPRPKTPADFYTKVIGRIVSQGRQIHERIVNNIQKYEIDRRANLKRNSDPSLEYVPTATERVQDDEMVKKQSKEQNWPKKYFSSILTSVGLHKLRNATDPEYLSKIISASATYINPLLNAWNRATMKLNSERDTTTLQHQSNETTDSDNDTSHNITYPPSSSVQSIHSVSYPASLGFRYAFSKYLIQSKGYGNDDKNKTISEQHSVTGGDANLNNNNTMGVDDVDFPIERIDERNDDTIEDNDDVDDNDESNENETYDDAGNFGIFILEIFGTIAGLTWGAFSQLQSLFSQNGN